MKTTYLIDLENVNSSGFEGASNLEEGDELIVFYSDKADTLKVQIITQLLKTSAEIKFYKCRNGIMNAMDFDIVSVLGIVYREDRDFVIVSKDKGFDVVVERYTSFGKKNVRKQSNIGKKKGTVQPVPAKTEVTEVLPEVNADSEKTSADDIPAFEEQEDAFDELIETLSLFSESSDDSDASAVPEDLPEQSASVEPEPEPEEQPTKATVKKKEKKASPANNEMSRVQKGKVNKFLNNLMGAKHEQPMTKDELKLIRETAESTRTKNGFYNALRKKLGNEKGIALYNRVKDEYDDIAKFIKNIKK